MLELADTRPGIDLRRPSQVDDLGRVLADACAAIAAAALGCCGIVLAVRRLASRIGEPPAPAVLLAAGAAGVALVVAADLARRVRATASPLPPVLARCGLLLGLGALAVPPRAPAAAGWATLAVCLVAAAATLATFPVPGCAADRGGRSVAPPPGRRRRRGLTAVPAARRERPAGQLRQRFERREVASGRDRVHGRLVLAIPAGARSASGHVGFCPAFAETPAVQVTTAYDGVEAVVSAAETLPWGVRVECRLAEPAEELLEIPVDLVAEATA